MASTWMILARVIRVVQAAVAEAEPHAAVAAARAELEERVLRVDAVPENNDIGEPGFTVSVAPPPRVTFLTAGMDSHPNPARPDVSPYIIATGPFCLLAHFATARHSGTDFRRVLRGGRDSHHLIMVRYFRRAGGHIAASAVRVPARPDAVPELTNIESVGLACDVSTGTLRQRTYNFRIAELMVTTGGETLELVVFRSDLSSWFSIRVLNPLVRWDGNRRWVPHGAVTVDSTIMWFDLTWGILTCDVERVKPGVEQEVTFYRLPRHRGLQRGAGAAPDDIHTRRCIGVSGKLLRYVEIDPKQKPNLPASTVSMWNFRLGEGGWRWTANYRVRFQEIWNDHSYAQTGLQREIPALAGVFPTDPDVVYFDLNRRLFGVNVPEHRVVDYEAGQHELVNAPGAPLSQTGSSRYLLTWNLLRPRPGTGTIIGHVSPDLPDDGFPDDANDKEPQDPKGKSKATDGRRKSTSAGSSRPSKALRI